MADPPNRKTPASSPYPSATGNPDLSNYFSEQGPAPAPAHEFINPDAETKVSSNRKLIGGQTIAYDAGDYFNGAPVQATPFPTNPGGWQPVGGDASEAMTLDASAMRQYLPSDLNHDEVATRMLDQSVLPRDPYDPMGYHYDPMGDVVEGQVVDPNMMVHGAPEYGLVPAGSGAPPIDPGMGEAPPQYSWIRVNAADHIAQPSHDLVMLSNPDGFAASQFRALRYRLEQEPNTQVIIVTSAREGDGRSVTAANLALALAEGGRIQVLLIDAALRNPAQHKLFGIRGELGLTSVLAARQNDPNLPIDVIRISTSLSLIPAGPPVQSAYAALSSEAAAVLMGQIRREYRYIIIDSAPVFGTAETLAWHGLIDKYVLLARAGKTTTEDLSQACDKLQRDRILGISFIGGKMKRI